MIPYLLRAALLIAASLLFYKVLLAKETFYRLNRVVLISCLLISFTLPIITVPKGWSLFEDQHNNGLSSFTKLTNATTPTSSINIDKSNVVVPTPQTPITQQTLQWIVILYWAGVIIFTLNFIIQLATIYYQAYSNDVVKDKNFRIIQSNSNKPPCSFANNIFINPAKYDWDIYSQILAHEKVHVRQKHTLDIVVMQLVLILQWFNPFAWLYRKEIENNLEFLTDDYVLKQDNIPKESYQYNLVKVSAPYLSLSITANYNTSLLKKRIMMINAKKSSLGTLWKYLFLAPLFICLACIINNPATGKQPPRHILASAQKNDTAVVKQARQYPPASNKVVTETHRSFKPMPAKPIATTALPQNTGVVTPEFIKSFQSIGYDNIPAGILVAFNTYGVDADFAKSFWFVGYDKITPQQLLLLKRLDITPDYVKSFWRVSYENEPIDKLIQLKQKNITPDQIAALENLGYKKSSVDSLLGIQ